MTKYIFVTGGVVSSLGKGLAASSIGCLLEGPLNIQLRRSGNRYTFGDGERAFSTGMAENAFVCWTVATERPMRRPMEASAAR